MATSALGRRYARSYFDIAVAEDAVEARGQELEQVATLLGDDRAAAVLHNPRLPTPERARFAESLLGAVAPQTRNLVRLLVERGRTQLIRGIAQEFARLTDAHAGVVRAEVIAAVPVDETLRLRVARELSQRLGTEVHTVMRQDAEILGGLVIRIGDRVIDASLRTKLQKLQAALA